MDRAREFGVEWADLETLFRRSDYVTLHLPETPGRAVALTKDGERALAHAYEFDNSPGFERFVFVTADVPFATDLVVRNLKQGAALPPALAIWSITLVKETP